MLPEFRAKLGLRKLFPLTHLPTLVDFSPQRLLISLSTSPRVAFLVPSVSWSVPSVSLSVPSDSSLVPQVSGSVPPVSFWAPSVSVSVPSVSSSVDSVGSFGWFLRCPFPLILFIIALLAFRVACLDDSHPPAPSESMLARDTRIVEEAPGHHPKS